MNAGVMTRRRREIAAHLDAVGDADGRWGAVRDLELVEAFMRGQKASRVADRLLAGAGEVTQRFMLLTECITDDRGVVDIDGQADLLAVLRCRAYRLTGEAAA